MPRAGSLDHPERYGAVSKAVYQNGTGYFVLVDGAREKLHGAQLWTTTSGIKMRGRSVQTQMQLEDASMSEGNAPDDGLWRAQALQEAEEEHQLAMAIAASLDEAGSVHVPLNDSEHGEEQPAGPLSSEGASGEEAPTCVICLSAPPNHVIKPCSHLCLCSSCATRVRREMLACPVCRRAQRSIERIFFA